MRALAVRRAEVVAHDHQHRRRLDQRRLARRPVHAQLEVVVLQRRRTVVLLGHVRARRLRHRDLDPLDAVAWDLDRHEVQRRGRRHLHQIAPAEVAAVPLVHRDEVAAVAESHRRVQVSVLVRGARGRRIVGERRARALQRRRVHPAVVVSDLLHQRSAVGRLVEPRITLGRGGASLSADPRPIARVDHRAHVPHVVVVPGGDLRPHRRRQAVPVAAGHRIAEGAEDVAGVDLGAERHEAVLPREVLPGTEDRRVRRRGRQVDAPADVDHHEGVPAGLRRDRGQPANDAVIGRRQLLEASDDQFIAAIVAPHPQAVPRRDVGIAGEREPHPTGDGIAELQHPQAPTLSIATVDDEAADRPREGPGCIRSAARPAPARVTAGPERAQQRQRREQEVRSLPGNRWSQYHLRYMSAAAEDCEVNGRIGSRAPQARLLLAGPRCAFSSSRRR